MSTFSRQTFASINIIPAKINYGFLEKWLIPNLGQANYKVSSFYVLSEGKEMLKYYWGLKRINGNAWAVLYWQDINKLYSDLLLVSLICILIITRAAFWVTLVQHIHLHLHPHLKYSTFSFHVRLSVSSNILSPTQRIPICITLFCFQE